MSTLDYISDGLTIKDEKLDIDLIGSYELNFYLSDFEFVFSVYCPNQHRCLRLESYIFPERLVIGKNDQMLRKVFEDNHLLPAAFWKKINLYLANRQYTFVPNEVFSEETMHDYYRFNHPFDDSKEQLAFSTFHRFTAVFGYSNALKEFFKKIYPSREVGIFSFLDNIVPFTFHRATEDAGTFVHVFMDEGLLTLLAVKNGYFQFCNTYLFKNLDDALYHVMNTYRELNLSPGEVPTEIYGNSNSLAMLQTRLFKYIQKVSLGKRPKDMKFSYQFDSIEDSRFFGLLNT